jgi:hypothetical protein
LCFRRKQRQDVREDHISLAADVFFIGCVYKRHINSYNNIVCVDLGAEVMIQEVGVVEHDGAGLVFQTV